VTEPTTFDTLTVENLAGESDIEVDEIELDKSEGTVVPDLAPALEKYDRWAPVVTMTDAERVFKRVKAPSGSYNKQAANYQRQ
jgi:hypothetical protein